MQNVYSNVLFHLIDNAQQATPDTGSVDVSVQCQHHQLCIEIKDTGCGMTEEFIQVDDYLSPLTQQKAMQEWALARMML
ncbi:MAG: ATP-binding protein [Rheinheimera sp.]|nr:ATP-binding protein [Rheinheimera sp.]